MNRISSPRSRLAFPSTIAVRDRFSAVTSTSRWSSMPQHSSENAARPTAALNGRFEAINDFFFVEAAGDGHAGIFLPVRRAAGQYRKRYREPLYLADVSDNPVHPGEHRQQRDLPAARRERLAGQLEQGEWHRRLTRELVRQRSVRHDQPHPDTARLGRGRQSHRVPVLRTRQPADGARPREGGMASGPSAPALRFRRLRAEPLLAPGKQQRGLWRGLPLAPDGTHHVRRKRRRTFLRNQLQRPVSNIAHRAPCGRSRPGAIRRTSRSTSAGYPQAFPSPGC